MPTENRSSNTEMVSESEMTECQFHNNCGGWCETRRELEHNLCEHCLESHDEEMSLPAPAPQPHPEPIAWMVGTDFWWTKEEAERDAAATGLPMTPVGPLTGSADVDQLREVIKHSDAQIMRQSMRISNQRTQLAERDATLRDSSGKLIQMAAHLISAPLFALQDLQDEDKKMTRARVDAAVDSADARLKDAAYEIRRIADALTASAEPSALPDPLGCNQCAHADCGKFDGLRQVE
ncbi:hypothetical protein [Pseudomonas monteilii]|uniref:hypothetical protein n=1 Tax=Pseudomonas monteilii TaxID=76759 RepID=UPI0016007549|nr:hypothetical protein [Pseudomonas monteilii]